MFYGSAVRSTPSTSATFHPLPTIPSLIHTAAAPSDGKVEKKEVRTRWKKRSVKKVARTSKRSRINDCLTNDTCRISPPPVGSRIEVFWPLDGVFYIGSVIRCSQNRTTVKYDDGETEVVDIGREQWRYEMDEGGMEPEVCYPDKPSAGLVCKSDNTGLGKEGEKPHWAIGYGGMREKAAHDGGGRGGVMVSGLNIAPATAQPRMSVIDLISDGDEEERNAETTDAKFNRRNEVERNNQGTIVEHTGTNLKQEDNVQSDDKNNVLMISQPTSRLKSDVKNDVLVISQPTSVVEPTFKTSGEECTLEASEDVAFIGSSGPNPLSDFPHCRENCAEYPLNTAGILSTQFCPNCYCFVCDDKASDCQFWSKHCVACYSSYYWKRERIKRKQKKNEESRKGLFTQGQSTTSSRPNILTILQRSHSNTESTPCSSTVAQYSHPTMKSIQSRLPFARFAAFNVSLDPKTQEQVVQTGDDIEPDSSSIAHLLNEITSVYPLEINPPDFNFVSILRHYQRQSLAFMTNLERSDDKSNFGLDRLGKNVKGGWLASEVGMGKSAIVIALVCCDKFGHQYEAKHIHEQLSKVSPPSMIKLNITVVLTSVSLMGQWEDECKKHAPTLVVKRFHPPSRTRVPINLKDKSFLLAQDLFNTDILLTTATFLWPFHITQNFTFHRVVMDESHLFSNVITANLQYALSICGERRWCVTATPCETSVSELERQIQFLCLDQALDRFTGRATVSDFYKAVIEDKEASFATIVDKLSLHTTRHTKSQSIGNSNALSLPPTTTKIITMSMSQNERETYNIASTEARKCMSKFRRKGRASIFQLEQQIHPTCSGLFMRWNESTKIRVLLEDVAIIKNDNPQLRIIVFTQFKHTHEEVVKALKTQLCAIYEITGSMSAHNRDFALRCFQLKSTYSAAIVVMLKAGSVGMSLQQGSHLFLMEPCLDPTAEKQAFGRINRLGQDKPATVKKFVFKDSIESNIVTLHEEMRTGRIKGYGKSFSKEAIEILCRE